MLAPSAAEELAAIGVELEHAACALVAAGSVAAGMGLTDTMLGRRPM